MTGVPTRRTVAAQCAKAKCDTLNLPLFDGREEDNFLGRGLSMSSRNVGIDAPYPRRLYKYREFSTRTLDGLVSDKIWFASPSTFNDPLDTRPSLDVDVTLEKLERALSLLIAARTEAMMKAGAKAARFRGPKTDAHIQKHSLLEAERVLKEIRYLATNPDYAEWEHPGPQIAMLSQYIENELLSQYDKGVFSLSERYASPLMWSHYGDQHRGICLGYTIPTNFNFRLHKVDYGGDRTVKASGVFAMTSGDETEKVAVDSAVFLRKAKDWRYEREWRIIGDLGLTTAPIDMVEVIFGLRCPHTVRYAVLKALEGRADEVEFFEIFEEVKSFKLRKRRVEESEMRAHFPQCARTVRDLFSDLTE